MHLGQARLLVLLLPALALTHAIAADGRPDPNPSPSSNPTPTASPEASLPAQCFDFAHPSTLRPLSAPIAFSSLDRADTVTSGPDPRGGGWSSARGILAAPIKQVLALLREQTTLKDPKDAEISVEKDTRPGFLDFQSVAIAIHPFPLITIRWTEDWAYRITQGTEATPLEATISYEKVAGTEHIKRFCGNIWIKADGPNTTDFAVYEEADATRRSPEAIAKGHLGTLRTLREKISPSKER